MRRELLCTISMRYAEGSWHRPYGSGDDGEGLGFGHGDGSVSGEIEGTMTWANYPRRRQDGVWTPNLRGRIALRDGNELLVAIHGQSVEERAPGHRRAILARVELTTEAEPYRWLNTTTRPSVSVSAAARLSRPDPLNGTAQPLRVGP